jgi:hypothetical protein
MTFAIEIKAIKKYCGVFGV